MSHVGRRSIPGKALEIQVNGESFQAPRIQTGPAPDVAGTYGPAAVSWGREALGITCRPWQVWALGRALEHRPDGSLRWPVVVLTVARQSGKSVMGRIACGWRLAEAAQIFGGAQTVVSTANKFATASELWSGVAYPLTDYPGARMKWGRGQEEIRMVSGPAAGSRWLVHAATANLAVGLTVSLGLVDEAWNVERAAVESALVPTMLEAESPQLWIVSTAGDSASDLLETYRQAAIKQLDDPAADVLILEWSAEPTAAIDDREAWRAASPHWSERRERYIETQLELIPESVFRAQLLNQRQDAMGGWCTRTQWADCLAPQLEIQTGPDAPRVIAAVEYSEDGSLYGLGVSQMVDDRLVFRTFTTRTIDELWALATNLPRSALLLVSAGFKGRVPLTVCESRLVGVTEVRLSTRSTHRAILDGMIAHDGNETLAAHVLTAVVAYGGEGGPVISQRRSPGPITLARIMCWCVGAQLEIDQRPAPRVVSAA